MKWILALCLLVPAACQMLPKDSDGTLPRIEKERSFRVGIVQGPEAIKFADSTNRFLARVGEAAGARPIIERGASEPLFLGLKSGRLDLVVATVAPESPWANEVAFLPPLAEDTADEHLLLTPVARNGENAWIMLLERQARQVRSGS